MNYGYDPFYIRAGHQVLDGATALKYARTRHGDNDFQRAQRQQLVMYAVRDRLLGGAPGRRVHRAHAGSGHPAWIVS